MISVEGEGGEVGSDIGKMLSDRQIYHTDKGGSSEWKEAETIVCPFKNLKIISEKVGINKTK